MQQEILNFWKDTVKTEDYSLYLHSPFCTAKCRYCVYTGQIPSNGFYKELYSDYVNKYLPVAIQAYDEIFTGRIPENFYFGGGTPNLIKRDDMKRIFNTIPNFDKIPNKIIDLHPGYLTDKDISFLIESGITTVCIGIQSFDENTLKLNNRKNPPFERIKKIVDIFHENNVYTSIDLMCFITNYNERDLDILLNDLNISRRLDLDFIDINPNLHFVLKEREYADLFEKTVDRIFETDIQYISEKNITGENHLNNRYIYRAVKKDVAEIFHGKVLPYYADDFPYAKNNIIGIGDLNNGHSTMSYIHNKLYYVEKNVNSCPTYKIKFIKQDNHLKKFKDFLSEYNVK